MSLFHSSVRPPAIVSDEAIERYVASIRTRIDPDPLFRRRLRGIVVSSYVAAREGLIPDSGPRSMGRLGRACLYASFVLGVSVTSVMAASESSVPGDLLYPLKRQIEHLRVQVLPDDYHHLLVAHDLSERISELDVLVARGDLARAEELAPAIAHDIEILPVDGGAGPELAPQLSVLEALVLRLPEPARAAIDHALAASTQASGPADPATGPAGAGDPPGAGHGPGGVGNGRGSIDAGGHRPSPGQPGTAGGASGEPAPSASPSEPGADGADAGAPGQGGSPPQPPQPSVQPQPSKSPKP